LRFAEAEEHRLSLFRVARLDEDMLVPGREDFEVGFRTYHDCRYAAQAPLRVEELILLKTKAVVDG
jgi:hypothetical protein